MLTISEEQYERINAAYRKHRRQRILRTLRHEGRIKPASTSDTYALAMIDEAIKEGASLDVIEDEEVLRLCRLVFAQRGGEVTASDGHLIASIISNVSIPAEERLGFIERRILHWDDRAD